MAIDTARDRRAALMDGTLPLADGSVDGDDRAQLAWEFTSGVALVVLFEQADLQWELKDGRLHYDVDDGRLHYDAGSERIHYEVG